MKGETAAYIARHGWITKPTAAGRRKKKLELRKTSQKHELDEKGKCRRRDRGCRFPRCGCRKLGLTLKVFLEVSHDKHKGMGGNLAGDRSTSRDMATFCKHRHQGGRVSIHKRTLRGVHLERDLGYDGPVAWLVDGRAIEGFAAYRNSAGWIEVARERAVGVLEPLLPWQEELLDRLAEMEL